ncbi:MAG: hypothetical protein ACFCU3_00525 [Verrucomicrobiales bacterium]
MTYAFALIRFHAERRESPDLDGATTQAFAGVGIFKRNTVRIAARVDYPCTDRATSFERQRRSFIVAWGNAPGLDDTIV